MASSDYGRGLAPRGKLAMAISAAISGTQAASAVAADAVLEEIIVTARKRTENLQDIPQSIQALSSQAIARAGITGLDDSIRLLPSVSAVAQAPGASKLIFRGVSDTNRSFFSDTSAALYLDEQPLTQPTQTPDPRLVDIERIEALAGPQGTLYGGSAQSGTLRIVTNKPDPTRFESNVDVTLKDGSDSAASYDVSGVLNLPLVQDKLAIRLVGFSATDGGFIDNVRGYMDQESAIPVAGTGGGIDNAAVAEDEQGGEVDYLGGRIALRWLPNDNWSVTVPVTFQDMDASGNFDHEPDIAGNLGKIRFIDEKREDTWTQAGLTIEGDLGFAQLVSATSYFTRDVFYNLDNTAYASYLRNIYVNYSYYNGEPSYVQYAFGPEPRGLGWLQNQDTRRFSQEFRLSRDGEKWAWVAGLFYEHFYDNWDFRTRLDNYEETNSFAYWQTYYGAEPGTSDNAFYNSNNKLKTDQYAVFGEATYTLDDHWSFTGGGRWFSTERDRRYFIAQPANRIAISNNPVETTRDFAAKASVQYRFDDRRLLYVLYSEGFRNGGGNVSRATGGGQILLPTEFDPDFLQNYELGFKSRWLDDRLQANLTLFYMQWDDFQTEVEDPGPGFATVVVNAGDAEIQGAEVQLSAVPLEGLELDINVTSLFKAELSDDLVLPNADGDPTVIYAEGARLAISPDLKVAASAQYTWQGQLFGGSPFARLQYTYQDESLSDLECNTDECGSELKMDSYSIVDAKVGLEAETWELSLFLNNLTDEQAEFYKFEVPPGAITVNRPREYGLRFVKRWGDSD